MSRDPTERTCLTFKSSQLEMLRAHSHQSGAPVAELVRRAVDAFLTAEVGGDRPEIDAGRIDPDSSDSLLDAGHEIERDNVEIVGQLLRILGFPDGHHQGGHGSRRSPRRHAGTPIVTDSL